MALNDRLNRVLRGVRRWRGGAPGGPIPVAPELTDGDWRHLAAEIDAVVRNRGGPVAARRRAGGLALTYQTLGPTGRRRFFTRLAEDFGHDDALVDEAMDAVMAASDPAERRAAEAELRTRLEPQREALFRRLAGLDGGLPFLIGMRADLLAHRADSPALAALDADLRRVLESWFDVGLLRLVRLTWDTPASFLEKLIEYEAVHAIESWDDLKNRLGPGRRCYAFVHPGMPDDPLIFVEVALTADIARELPPLLSTDRDLDDLDETQAETAIFYSISNCHEGLAGVSLGDFLIKSVVEELIAELPRLKTFATLSPMPGFRRWLEQRLADDAPLPTAPGDDDGGASEPDRAGLAALVAGPPPAPGDGDLESQRSLLLRLAAAYLLDARSRGRAADPVAHFHLSNGAVVEQLNWLGNPTPVGWERGLGMMVNYRYDLKTIERNHDAYLIDGTVAANDRVRRLVGAP